MSITPRSIKVLLEKEFLDLIRDRKTLASTILMPLILMPMLGLVSLALIAQQPVKIAIVDRDNSVYTNSVLNITVSSKWLVYNISWYLEGIDVVITDDESVRYDPSVDLIVVIPEGFSKNATLLNTTANIVIIRKAGYQSAQNVEGLIHGIVNAFSYNISKAKINALARLANQTVNYEAVRNPVKSRTELVTVKGEGVTFVYELRNLFARLLVLALSFVVSPAAFYIIDGIIGERERKTFEFLLVSPVTVTQIIIAKVIAATTLGLIAALSDAIGLIGYMLSISLIYSGGMLMVIDYGFLVLHAITAFFTILTTISIALPFITRTRGVRSASNIASIITTMGIIMFFTGFFIDYVKLPEHILYPLYLIPYVHSILVIQTYMLEDVYRSIIHILVLALTSLILLYITSRIVNTEKIIASTE